MVAHVLATAPFADEAVEQAGMLGMPGCQVIYIPHPVQLLTDGELTARADAIFPAVIAALTGTRQAGDLPGTPGGMPP